jgi:DNA-directed RNA polymerase specialized sigma24 family protein
MSSDGSITNWIGGLKRGDEEAARLVWERYFQRLVGLARDRLRSARASRLAGDEEDVALSALNSVYLGAADGRFPLVTDRHGLWRLLVVIAARKASNAARSERTLKRGGGRVRTAEGGDGDDAVLARAVAREPSPELAAAMADSLDRLLNGLADETLRRIAVLRLEGQTNDEIAGKLGCAPRTVVRKLEIIRRHWSEEGTC